MPVKNESCGDAVFDATQKRLKNQVLIEVYQWDESENEYSSNDPEQKFETEIVLQIRIKMFRVLPKKAIIDFKLNHNQRKKLKEIIKESLGGDGKDIYYRSYFLQRK